MSVEPEKFFIGVVDVFAVLLPGGLLAYVGKDWAAVTLMGVPRLDLSGAEAWMIFAFGSYLLGHFIFLIGANLDDWVYDPLRSCTDWGQIRRLARGKHLQPRLARKFATSRWLFGENADAAVMEAQRLKARTFSTADAGVINAYQWSKIRLSKHHPPGLVAVQRFEADSKFFRSLLVVLLVLGVLLIRERPAASVAAFVCVPLALWRYVDQRFKATQHAYWNVLSLEPATAPAVTSCRGPASLTHAGGVVMREDERGTEYLLVRANRPTTEWVLPKGHIEPGEDPRETAVREVREEAGHWARVVKFLDDVPLGSGDDAPRCRFYLMRACGDDSSATAEPRKRLWLPLTHAVESASFEDTRTLLAQADLAARGASPRSLEHAHEERPT